MLKDQPTLFDTPSKEVLYSSSPINTRKCGGDNLEVLNYLLTGVHTTVKQVEDKLGIRFANSRFSDLGRLHNIQIERKFIDVTDSTGEKIKVKQYWMAQEEIQRVKGQWR